MDVVAAISGILILLGVILRANVGVMLFLVYNFVSAIVGLTITANDGDAYWSTPIVYASCVAALAGGFVIAKNVRLRERESLPNPPRAIEVSDGAVLIMTLTVGGLALYHLVVSGIPLFSSSVEVDRFDFTSSGFFGIPGRMFLYGVPLSWMLATAVAQSKQIRWRDYKPWWAATAFYFVVSVLSGFKSGLLAMAVTVIIAAVVITGIQLRVGRIVARYWWALIVPVGFGLLVSTTYSSYSNGSLPLWRQLLDRVTVIGSQPKQYAIEGRIAGDVNTNMFSDLLYYLHKYSGHTLPGSYSFERSVSAQIIGVNPADASFTTPVTVGAFPELIHSLGVPAAIIAALIVGVLLQLLHRQTRSYLTIFARAALVYCLYSWLLKGGLAYYALNIAAVLLMLLAILLAASLLVRPSRPVLIHSEYALSGQGSNLLSVRNQRRRTAVDRPRR